MRKCLFVGCIHDGGKRETIGPKRGSTRTSAAAGSDWLPKPQAWRSPSIRTAISRDDQVRFSLPGAKASVARVSSVPLVPVWANVVSIELSVPKSLSYDTTNEVHTAKTTPRPRRRAARARFHTMVHHDSDQSFRPVRPMRASAPTIARTVETTRNPGVSSEVSSVSVLDAVVPPSPTTTSPNMSKLT